MTTHPSEQLESAWEELKTLLASRIHEGLAGKVSANSISKILEEELHD